MTPLFIQPRLGLPLSLRLSRRLGLLVGAGLVGAAGCANLFDIPEEPRLAGEPPSEQSAAVGGVSESAVGADAPAGGAGNRRDGLAPESAAEQSAGSAEQASQAESPISSNSEVDAENLMLQPSELPAQTDATGSSTESSAAEPADVTSAEADFSDAGVPAVDLSADAGVPLAQPQDEPSQDEPFFEQGACPVGAVEGPNERCFALQAQLLPWADAREGCRELGAGWDLVSIRSAEVDTFVSALSDEEVWIGASDQQVDATWIWVDDDTAFFLGDVDEGEAVDDAYLNWNPTEPNGRGNSGCARTVPNAEGAWADLECEFERAAVCHGPPVSSP